MAAKGFSFCITVILIEILLVTCLVNWLPSRLTTNCVSPDPRGVTVETPTDSNPISSGWAALNIIGTFGFSLLCGFPDYISMIITTINTILVSFLIYNIVDWIRGVRS